MNDNGVFMKFFDIIDEMIGTGKGIGVLGTGVIYLLGHDLAAMAFHGIPPLSLKNTFIRYF